MTDSDHLSDLLDRIGAELLRVADDLSRVDVAAGGLAPSAPGIIGLQGIDEAEQTLRAVACVLRRASASGAASAWVDIGHLAEGLPLDHMVGLVRGTRIAAPARGEVELF